MYIWMWIYIYIYIHTDRPIIVLQYIYIIEGRLEVKFPTIWTDGKAEVGRVREEKSRREKIRERVRRKKMQVAKHCVSFHAGGLQRGLPHRGYNMILVGGAMCPSWKMMEFVNGFRMTCHIWNGKSWRHVWNHQPGYNHYIPLPSGKLTCWPWN